MEVNEASKYLYAALEQGTTCPCCGRKAKAYRRHLYKTQINALQRIASFYNVGREFHLGEFLSKYKDVSARGGDVARLRYWGLIEAHGKGRYSITKLGKKFLEGKAMVPKWLSFYDGKVIERNKIAKMVGIGEFAR